ncbi:unnamed protein product, partial [marine sediment metagenome]
ARLRVPLAHQAYQHASRELGQATNFGAWAYQHPYHNASGQSYGCSDLCTNGYPCAYRHANANAQCNPRQSRLARPDCQRDVDSTGDR